MPRPRRQPAPARPRPALPAGLIALGLAAVAAAAYAPAVGDGFVSYDDPLYVSENPRVLGGLTGENVAWAWTTGHAANWHPLTWLSLQLDATLLGLDPAGFHFTNLAIHAANSALVFLALRRLTGAGARHIVSRIRKKLGAWSFKSPHVARHTTATTLLEVTGGDVRLVQEVLGHANLNTLQGYTKIVDARKQDAYKRYQEFLDDQKPAGC